MPIGCLGNRAYVQLDAAQRSIVLAADDRVRVRIEYRLKRGTSRATEGHDHQKVKRSPIRLHRPTKCHGHTVDDGARTSSLQQRWNFDHGADGSPNRLRVDAVFNSLIYGQAQGRQHDVVSP